MQEWSMVTAVTGGGGGGGGAESNLVLKASNWTSKPPDNVTHSCEFVTQHSHGITVSADGKTATDTGGVGNQHILGSCSPAVAPPPPPPDSGSPDSGSPAATLISFSLHVISLNGEAFIGVSAPANAAGWPNRKGSWAFGSHGLGASAAGYTASGANIDPRTGRKTALPSWVTGDVITVAVNSARDMSVSVNGATPVVLFKGIELPAASSRALLQAAVWMSPSSIGSKFSFARGASGVPACMTATPTAKATPWVVATRYPATGAVSVTSLARTAPRPIGYHTPLANVTQQTMMGLDLVMTAASGSDGGSRVLPPIAVFGTFGSLTLGFEAGTVGKISAVHAQDLRGELPLFRRR